MFSFFIGLFGTTGLIRDGQNGRAGMEVGDNGDYIPIATLSPPE